MADANKAEKLAAARKKLKEFQQRNRQSPTSSPKDRDYDVSSPASVTSQTSSVDLKAGGQQQFESISFDSQPHFPPVSYNYSSEYNYQSPSGDGESGQINNVTNSFGGDPVYSHEHQTADSMPYYYNGAAATVSIISEEKHPELQRKFSTNSYDASNEITLRSQIAERDNTIASLQYQLQSLSLSANSNKDHELQSAVQDVESRWSSKVKELEEQLRVHAQTVNILVGEKTEYQSSLAKANESLKSKAGELDEAQQHLRSLQQKLNQTEAALNSVRTENSSKLEAVSESQRKFDELFGELKKTEIERDEHKQQASQLQQRINVTMQQVSMLQTELQEKQAQLTSTQVRLKQMGGSFKDSEDSSVFDELKAEKEKSAGLEKLIADMKSELSEKEQASQQYQQFVQQLNNQLSTLASKLQETTQENDKLKEQNEQMVEHVSSLESRLNKINQLNAHNPPPVDSKELEMVKEELKAAVEENGDWKRKIQEQETERLVYEESILRYQETIRRLEEERPDEKKLLAAMESDRVAAQRATAQNSKLKDQLLEMEQMKAQMIEQLHTYEARARQAQSLQECLIEAQNEIKNLKNQLIQKSHGAQVNGHDTGNEEESLSAEASKKLQDRFTDVMKKLADTADEKQRLEHLVLQLQGETETIGEYVTLYQQQRCLLRERAAEKDREIARMGTERDELLLELKKVGHLVLQLVNGQRDNNSVPLSEPKDYESVALEIADQVTTLLNKMEESSQESRKLTDEELMAMHSERNALSHNQDTLLPCPCCSGRLEVV
ncbi:golgin subfamily A member 2 [Neocloeon triangulifer]|uniref:golgin subfamily A member 2 n=1 Tax=Neocloeon triangulifer TaxID=2078957 RepID=UPI00286F184B|nr:golgin subfamily A member 2 [Neocloeon triangulifer]